MGYAETATLGGTAPRQFELFADLPDAVIDADARRGDARERGRGAVLGRRDGAPAPARSATATSPSRSRSTAPRSRPLAHHATGGSFLNFLKDPARTHTAYTAADYRRLREVKRAHDPDNVFAIGHNIPRHPRRTNVERIQSSDGTPIAFDRSGDGPPVIFVPGLFQHRAIDPGTAELAALLAAALHRVPLRPPRPRRQRRHGALRGRARGRGHRRADRRGGRLGRALRDVLRRRAGARGGRARPRGHEAGGLRAAVHGRRGQDRAVARSSPPGSPSTSRRAAPATRSRCS